MNERHIRILNLLDRVDMKRPPSQREMARELDISLGLVNSSLKQLSNQGYLKIVPVRRNRVKYKITSKGAAEKTRLTYSYLQYSSYLYEQAICRIHRRLRTSEDGGARRIIFFGVSDLVDLAILALGMTRISLTAIVDTARAGTQIHGRKVLPPSALKKMTYDLVLITAVEALEQIETALLHIEIPKEKILLL